MLLLLHFGGSVDITAAVIFADSVDCVDGDAVGEAVDEEGVECGDVAAGAAVVGDAVE